MKDKSLIHYRIDFDYFKNKILDDSEFLSLSLEEQKEIVISVLDKNIFYIPYSEMEDAMFSLSEEDIKICKEFYKEN